MDAIQEISGRIGRVTGHGIAGNVCRNFLAPFIWTLVTLLPVANTINIAADLGAMADSTKLLIGGWSPIYVVIYAVGSVTAQIFLSYKRYVAILKWLTLVLFAYVIALAIVHVPWGEALRGLLIPKSNARWMVVTGRHRSSLARVISHPPRRVFDPPFFFTSRPLRPARQEPVSCHYVFVRTSDAQLQ
jgi:Mn2+/Fe2+ NRAMP family transporter